MFSLHCFKFRIIIKEKKCLVVAEEGNSWDMIGENDLWEGQRDDLDQEDYVLVRQEDIVEGIACFMAAYLLSIKQTKVCDMCVLVIQLLYTVCTCFCFSLENCDNPFFLLQTSMYTGLFALLYLLIPSNVQIPIGGNDLYVCFSKAFAEFSFQIIFKILFCMCCFPCAETCTSHDKSIMFVI